MIHGGHHIRHAGHCRCTARYLLIIEKDAIFQALTQDKLFEQLPCVLVTAKGMPDVATRAFCSRIMSAFPSMTVSLKQSTDSFGLDSRFVNHAADTDPLPHPLPMMVLPPTHRF